MTAVLGDTVFAAGMRGAWLRWAQRPTLFHVHFHRCTTSNPTCNFVLPNAAAAATTTNQAITRTTRRIATPARDPNVPSNRTVILRRYSSSGKDRPSTPRTTEGPGLSPLQDQRTIHWAYFCPPSEKFGTEASFCGSQDPSEWEGSQDQLHLDTSQSTLVIRPQAPGASALHKAPLAPKQGLGGSLANARAQHSSPISGTYALRTPRGKITSIACESCRKRKSKSKNLTCVYDVAEDGKTTTQLRAHVRRLAKELDDMKSIVSLLAMAPDRAQAANWASELEKNGFQHHSVEEIKKSLQDPSAPQPALPDQDSFGTSGSDQFPGHGHGLEPASYDDSSREESNAVDGITRMDPPLDIEGASTALSKFSFDCTYFRRAKRDLLANGWSESQIFGRAEVDVDTILLGFVDPQDTQTVPTCILSGPAWKNMNANPDWMMPSIGKEEVTPYDILIDLVPWPQVRQLLYQHPQEYPVGHFVGLIGVTWPFADDACHYWDIEAGYTRMTPLFESTVADLNNWTIDPKILELAPQLEGLLPIKPV
ncbi:hypothetical protein SNOG_07947 [Parastagonospora nodorum SN15]|uniref:Uncharacterized protein n=1 Tax=Phaeosphaeria nodorum (strain SN15 / ATCC MYA-4574 / FGSC 10173) TaxID=321614 RepID=Q0UJW7_PHANO|nr:hypothetical protein SNOG_07947 [Parastagonospora nodorum SN15]EAT84223.1 hypothetical protein SNOG_07947 [Parastagonospora nodorum SN15]